MYVLYSNSFWKVNFLNNLIVRYSPKSNCHKYGVRFRDFFCLITLTWPEEKWAKLSEDLSFFLYILPGKYKSKLLHLQLGFCLYITVIIHYFTRSSRTFVWLYFFPHKDTVAIPYHELDPGSWFCMSWKGSKLLLFNLPQHIKLLEYVNLWDSVCSQITRELPNWTGFRNLASWPSVQ